MVQEVALAQAVVRVAGLVPKGAMGATVDPLVARAGGWGHWGARGAGVGCLVATVVG